MIRKISWIFSILFGLVGIASLAKTPIFGLLTLVLAIVIFPKTKEFIKNKFGYILSRKLKIGIAIVLFIGMVIALPGTKVTPAVENQQSTLQQANEQAAATTSPEATTQPQSDSISTPQTQVADGQQNNPAPTPTQAQPSGLVKVVSVTDGDTIKVSINGTTQTIRMIGMDTPETVDPRKPVQCFGKEASNKTKATLLNQMVRLESDPTQGDLDKYQRLLRYVFLSDGTNFEKSMIEQGYAYEYTYNIPYKYQAEFKAAQKDAQQNQRGLWSPTTCNGTTSPTSGTTQPTPTPTAQPAQTSGHTFYLSSYKTAKYYYCDTDDGWKGLTPEYLKSYPSEQALLKDYPSRTLHEACK
ncbi:MAG: thermonuclease family protein [Candidatus Buchananbacteria bacterium]